MSKIFIRKCTPDSYVIKSSNCISVVALRCNTGIQFSNLQQLWPTGGVFTEKRSSEGPSPSVNFSCRPLRYLAFTGPMAVVDEG